MTITPQEFYQALSGEAEEALRQRVLAALQEGDPVLQSLIESRRQRALALLKLTTERPIDPQRFPKAAE